MILLISENNILLTTCIYTPFSKKRKCWIPCWGGAGAVRKSIWSIVLKQESISFCTSRDVASAGTLKHQETFGSSKGFALRMQRMRSAEPCSLDMVTYVFWRGRGHSILEMHSDYLSKDINVNRNGISAALDSGSSDSEHHILLTTYIRHWAESEMLDSVLVRRGCTAKINLEHCFKAEKYGIVHFT